MMTKVGKNHPHNSKGEKYGYKEIMSEVDVGSHGCFSTSNKSHLDSYGSGISLYFRFVKFLTMVFLVLSVITLPSMSLNIMAHHNRGGSSSMSDLLFASTLGSLSYLNKPCQLAYYPTYAPNTVTNPSQI